VRQGVCWNSLAKKPDLSAGVLGSNSFVLPTSGPRTYGLKGGLQKATFFPPTHRQYVWELKGRHSISPTRNRGSLYPP